MKHNPIILTVLLMGLVLFGCKKQEQETLSPKIKNDKVETTTTTAIFTWTVDWPGKLISVVEVSENENMSHSQIYGSETETENHNFTVTVTDLKVATKYYYRYLVWNKFYVDNKFDFEVKSFSTQTDLPKVKTVEVTDVTRTTATVIGEVIDECGAEVTERGVCWGTDHNPTTSGSHLNSGTGLGTYSIALSNLEVEKTYYVRAYAKNTNGTAYSDDELSFTTGDAVKPTVTTAEITNIDWRTATGGGEVTDDGDANVTERGICWSTSHNPEVSGDHANNGTGTGNYTVNMTGLTAGTTYYVRAYAKNIAGLNYGNEVSFVTKAPELPTVTTNSITDISWTTATGGGNVTSDGGIEVTECGICWGTSHNPDIGSEFSHIAASSAGTESFSVNITGLTAGTTYYVRAYAKNNVGVNYGEEKNFETTALQKPTVTTTAISNITQTSAKGRGNVTCDGGSEVIERGIYYGTIPNPSQTGTKLVASSSGTGSYSCTMYNLNNETTYFICAYATNNQGTSYGEEMSFKTPVPPPTGSVSGLFTISPNKQVYFSKGNLQWSYNNGATHAVSGGGTASGTWRFAEHQWTYIGEENKYISSNYNGWIDLFSWGTSGWNSGANCYQPWSTSFYHYDFYPGGSYTNNLTGGYSKADWGVFNAISNGGNQPGLWRTLTNDEWWYIFNTRSASVVNGVYNARYAKAKVADIHGVILFPDTYSHPSGVTLPVGINDAESSGWDGNYYSISDFEKMEAAGAVFLPAAGRWYVHIDDYIIKVADVDVYGNYSSTSIPSWSNGYSVCAVVFRSSSLYDAVWRNDGSSVRLVRDAQ